MSILKNQFTFKLVTGPLEEPVTPAEAASFLRIPGVNPSTLELQGLIEAARLEAETWTSRCFINQTWDMFIHGELEDDVIIIPKSPLISVSFFKSFNPDNEEDIIETSDYTVITDALPGLIQPKGSTFALGTPGQSVRPWASYQVRFIAGMAASAALIPAGLKNAILTIVADYYENRAIESTGLTRRAKILLAKYRVNQL